jgi:carboxypeptidase C (cathepsin A)
LNLSFILRLSLVAAVVGGIGIAAAQERNLNAADKPQDQTSSKQAKEPARAGRDLSGKGILQLLPADSVTARSIDTAQGKLAYTATAGTLAFFDQSGERSASVFYTAYVANDKGGDRPLTFVFNGGPGAASAFLHLGLVGPRILDFGPGAREVANARLIDNPDTWLRFTDLVIIDPIGTGWSRTVKAEDGKHFWSVEGDAGAIAKAIALYVAHNDRAASPKYLFGESYGGFRAAKVARALEREQGMATAGLVMLSPLLEGWLVFGDDESALRSALVLPSLAAAELERKGEYSPDALASAEKFAMTDYLVTLAGATPEGAAADAFYDKVAQVSGLSPDQVKRQRGFVTHDVVRHLRSGKLVSRYDASYAVDDPHPERIGGHAPDPVLDHVARAYGGAFAAYARNELGFKTEMTYKLLANDVTKGWNWRGGRINADVEGDLRVLLGFDRSFRVLVAHGVADLVTPYGMSRYVIDHMPRFDPPGRIALRLYRGGHMLYLDPASRKAFSADAATFYRAAEKE